jgi:uncharacterized protein
MSQNPRERASDLDYGYQGTASNVRVTFFHQVYLWMAIGLALTAVISYAMAHFINTRALDLNTARMIMIGAGIGVMILGFTHSSIMERVSVTGCAIVFLAYAGLMGVCTSYIWLVYPVSTLGAAFAITGAVFGGLSVFGFVTKKDLSSMGPILFAGVLGVFVASIVNMFVANNALSWVLTYVMIALMIGIIMYYTQQLKHIADAVGHDPLVAPKYAIMGAFMLYWAFINLFLEILRVLGSRR